MPNKLDFPKGKGSNIHIVILVPSTKGINKKITKKQFKTRVMSVVKFLRSKFGGSTRVRGVGDFHSQELGKPVQEQIAKVETFTTTKDYNRVDKQIRNFLLKKKKAWSQESIGYQYEGSMYFV